MSFRCVSAGAGIGGRAVFVEDFRFEWRCGMCFLFASCVLLVFFLLGDVLWCFFRWGKRKKAGVVMKELLFWVACLGVFGEFC